jgi:excisionase family DNA binding protein
MTMDVEELKTMPRSTKRSPLRNLKTHPGAYVTPGELAEYWLVNRRQIYKQIDAGTLPAIRLGPRLWRVRTADAIEFERAANMRPPEERRVIAAEERKHMAKVTAAEAPTRTATRRR